MRYNRKLSDSQKSSKVFLSNLLNKLLHWHKVGNAIARTGSKWTFKNRNTYVMDPLNYINSVLSGCFFSILKIFFHFINGDIHVSWSPKYPYVRGPCIFPTWLFLSCDFYEIGFKCFLCILVQLTLFTVKILNLVTWLLIFNNLVQLASHIHRQEALPVSYYPR